MWWMAAFGIADCEASKTDGSHPGILYNQSKVPFSHYICIFYIVLYYILYIDISRNTYIVLFQSIP